MRHKPVLVRELLEGLALNPGHLVADGTLGSGGHSLEILQRIGPKGKLIGLDQDPAALDRCREHLKEYAAQISLHHENFENLDEVLENLNIQAVDAVILDVGFSSDQMETAARGFSFDREGPLDMRMNPDAELGAGDLVRLLDEQDLADLFWKFGEERSSRRIARRIVEERERSPIQTTAELAKIVEEAMGIRRKPGAGIKSRIHPATRVFQALRIAVNRELEVLENGLPKIWKKIRKGGRLAVISFHSLEDRIVKWQFRRWAESGEGKLINKKPVEATEEERRENPRSRSAKLRTVEKIL